MDSGLVFAEDLPPATLHDRVAKGQLSRLTRGVYTADVSSDPDAVVRRTWREIVGRRFAGAVVTDRSARWAQPHDGQLFISSSRTGVVELPGLTVVSRKGPGAAEGDMPLGFGLHLASRPRALLDNARATRRRADRPAATLSPTELADWIDHLCAVDGEARVAAHREAAERLVPVLDVSPAQLEVLNAVVGAALGTRRSTTGSAALRARSRGAPFDQLRMARFQLLADHLRDVLTTYPALEADASRRRSLPFWEAYFSNFIEGTEFSPDEAVSIVFDGEIPGARPADAHDIIGTYEIVSDDGQMRHRVGSADELIERLRAWNRTILGGRPDKRPGELKVAVNQAGATVFVLPELVEGTLRRGYELLDSLPTPTQRAAFVAFLVAEVHPFDDGNGRLARTVMDAELVAGDEQRAIIPTILRNDYLRGLRRLSRQDRPDLFVAVLDRARRWTSRMDWSGPPPTTRRLLERSNAFVDATDAEDRGIHLLDP
jgi:hypothetical protein